jgi:hypothetical protein
MMRYSYTFSFIPLEGRVGSYVFYLTRTDWNGKNCVSSTTVAEKIVHGIVETHVAEQFLQFAVAMSDLAYVEVTRAYAESKRPSNGEVNARPSNTSTN